jgi:hypothetical protein
VVTATTADTVAWAPAAGSGCGLREENRREDAHPPATRGLRGLTEEGSRCRVVEETQRSGGLRRWQWAPTFSAVGARRGCDGGPNRERKGSGVDLTGEGGRRHGSDEFGKDKAHRRQGADKRSGCMKEKRRWLRHRREGSAV